MAKRRVWQLPEAKGQFNELFRRVRSDGPQRVVRQRGEAVVVVRAEDLDRIREIARQPESLVKFFQSSPAGSKLHLTRKRDATRTIKW